MFVPFDPPGHHRIAALKQLAVPYRECRACGKYFVYTDDNLCPECFQLREESIAADVDKIEKISREATELIQNGIEFTSSAPLYYNTKLAEVKMELLAKASADAKARADAIAKNAGNSLGKLKKATMGVFQITGKNSNEDFSYGGAFNTSNRLKTGSITIKMEFSAD